MIKYQGSCWNGAVVAQLIRNQQAVGSNPISSSILKVVQKYLGYLFWFLKWDLKQGENCLAIVIYTNPDGVHEFASFVSNQFKNITHKAPTKSADIRYSHRSGVDLYSKEEYNSFGWVRANDVVNEWYWNNFTQNYADAVYNKAKQIQEKYL